MKTKKTLTKMKFGIAASIAAVALMSFTMAGGWEVPAAEAAKANPVASNPESIASGKALYDKHCKMCHGATGEGGKMAGNSNLKSPEFKAQTDGAMFYKITTGFGKMPGYKTKIADETDRWHVVNYMKSL